MRSPLGSQVFAQVSGAASSGVTLLGNSLNQGQQAVSFSDGATKESVKVD